MNCDGCTLCCTLLPVEWMDSAAGSPCRECDAGVGCKIFAAADPRCRSFECMYRQAGTHTSLRPDNCGVVFEKMDGLVYGSIDPVIGLTDTAKGQVLAFNREGLSVVLDDMMRKILICAPRPGAQSADVMDDFTAQRDKRMRAD